MSAHARGLEGSRGAPSCSPAGWRSARRDGGDLGLPAAWEAARQRGEAGGWPRSAGVAGGSSPAERCRGCVGAPAAWAAGLE